MHDPMTLAFEIRYPWRKFGAKGKEGFAKNYHATFISIWHSDPEKGCSDDSCDWFGRMLTAKEKQWATELITNEYDNVRTMFSQWIKLPHGEGRCDDPDDCYCGEHIPLVKEEEMISRVMLIASSYKRNFGRRRIHPRWHVHHWKIVCDPLVRLKRWLFSRCCKCHGSFEWGESVIGYAWESSGPLWFRSEQYIAHTRCDLACGMADSNKEQ